MNKILHTISFAAVALLINISTVYGGNTQVSIRKNQFYINGELTYSGRYWDGNRVEGLLLNSRMVNGIFDDRNDETRDSFKYPDTNVWDADRNTGEFVEQMEQWNSYGLLAFTLNMQGGSPMGYGNKGWINSAFDKDGELDAAYLARLTKVLDRADELGMVVTLGYFYFGADQYLEDEAAVINATRNITEWILKNGYENVIIEIANECDIYYDHKILQPERIGELIEMVQSMSYDGRHLMVGTSFSGVKVPTAKVAEVSDFILIHGNGANTPSKLREFIHRVKKLAANYPSKPIIINEDDHFDFEAAESNLSVAIEEYVSWGYFDYRKKDEKFECGFQSIPASWAISSPRKQSFFDKVKQITAWGEAPELFNNPILSGYHPDPSICRVGDEYYMVNSSFEWWPCMPIHKSRDLVNWELVGYGRVDPEKLPVKEGTRDSGGIYAATIRHHDGLFYLITTMIGGKGNFYITAEDPTGEWSDPVWLHSEGIDPSLFWDDDNRCYYVGHGHPDNPKRVGNTNIWVQELDLEQGKLVGEAHDLTEGHSVVAGYPEGPHIYKYNGKYVLMIAEGGTGFTHSVTQFTSDHIFGPYTANQINPILSHRHLGNDGYIQSIGHADIVQTQKGDWWMVALGTRHFGKQSYLARETFLTPMEWESTYGALGIVVNRGKGQVLAVEKRPDLEWSPIERAPARDEFNKPTLELEWNQLRSPKELWYKLGNGELTMNVRPESASQFVNPSLLAQRIRDIYFETSARVEFSSKAKNEEAGVILYRDSEHYLTFTKRGKEVVVSRKSGENIEQLATATAPKGDVVLYVKADGKNLTFKYSAADGEMKDMQITTPLALVGNNTGGQFNGPMVGIYTSSNGVASRSKATFKWFEYK